MESIKVRGKQLLLKLSNNRYIKGFLVGLMAYLCVLALSQVSEAKGNPQILGMRIEAILLTAAVVCLLVHFNRIEGKRLKAVSGIGGILLAFSHVFGVFLHYKNDLFVSAGEVLRVLLLVAGTSALTIPLFGLVLVGLDKITAWWQAHENAIEAKKKGLFLKYWLSIFACYVPVFLANWPVNFVYDARYQMTEVINNTYKVHHPLLHTLLMGEMYKLGGKLGSVSLGISFYTLIQMLILSAVFAYTMVYLYRHRVPKAIRIAAWIFFAVFPLNPLFAITATKDVLFAAFFLGFVVVLLQIFEEGFSWQKVVWLVVLGTLMLLFRKNAVYALVVALPFLVCAIKGKRGKGVMLLLLVGTIFLADGINEGMIKTLNAYDDGSTREAMSVPLQQLARVAAYRRGELSDDLYQEIIQYIEESALAEYNPYLSDPVKGAANEELLKNNMANFFKLWAKVGLQFPGEYLESFLTNTLGYWYLGDTGYTFATGDEIALYHTLIGIGEEIEKHDYCKPVSAIYNPLFYQGNYRQVPILGYLFRSSVYFWMLIVAMLYMVYRRDYRKLLWISLPFAYFASCFLGPWVALRYIYCIAVCLPVVAALCFGKNVLRKM